jgi:hypothetical protein
MTAGTLPLCPHCKTRRKVFDEFEEKHGVSSKDYCDICRAAHCIAHTSVDDARSSLRLCDNVDVIYMAGKMEKASTNPRSSMISLLNRKLEQLVKIKGITV